MIALDSERGSPRGQCVTDCTRRFYFPATLDSEPMYRILL